jgi:hypothetical protein
MVKIGPAIIAVGLLFGCGEARADNYPRFGSWLLAGYMQFCIGEAKCDGPISSYSLTALADGPWTIPNDTKDYRDIKDRGLTINCFSNRYKLVYDTGRHIAGHASILLSLIIDGKRELRLSGKINPEGYGNNASVETELSSDDVASIAQTEKSIKASAPGLGDFTTPADGAVTAFAILKAACAAPAR